MKYIVEFANGRPEFQSPQYRGDVSQRKMKTIKIGNKVMFQSPQYRGDVSQQRSEAMNNKYMMRSFNPLNTGVMSVRHH